MLTGGSEKLGYTCAMVYEGIDSMTDAEPDTETAGAPDETPRAE